MRQLKQKANLMQKSSEQTKETSIRAIDLFCGAGGSSWGAQQAGAEIVAAFDMWDTAALVHRANFPGTKFYKGKLENLKINQIAKELGKIELILASPECTNHSPAKGRKRRCEKSRLTAFQVIRFARKLKPRWVVVENVVSMRRWRKYKQFKVKLESLGYNVREQVLNAKDFGVPQSRRRLFIMCDLDRKPATVTPPPQLRLQTARSIISLNGIYPWTSLRTPSRAPATLARARRAIRTVGSRSAFLIVYYGSDGAGGWQKLGRPLRTLTTLDRFAVVKPTRNGHVMRMLQVPELQAAMAMRGMKFNNGTRRDRIKMIGNAVCPPAMKAVVSNLVDNTNGDSANG